MTKTYILVVHTKLTFNLAYNGLKGTFSHETSVYKEKQGYKPIFYLDYREMYKVDKNFTWGKYFEQVDIYQDRGH